VKVTTLPFEPETLEHAKARLRTAAEFVEPLTGIANARKHVFDFKSGFRLVVGMVSHVCEINSGCRRAQLVEVNDTFLRVSVIPYDIALNPAKYQDNDDADMLEVSSWQAAFDLTEILVPAFHFVTDTAFVFYYDLESVSAKFLKKELAPSALQK
jgi:hypothetical protein